MEKIIDTVSIRNSLMLNLVSKLVNNYLKKRLGVEVDFSQIELNGYEDGYVRAKINANISFNLLKTLDLMKGAQK